MLVYQELSNATSAVRTALGTLLALFGTWLTEETAIVDWVRKSSLTKDIEEADRAMDRTLSALKLNVRSQKLSTNATVAQAADRVYTMLHQYGVVNSKPYEEQRDDVRTIIRQLNSSAYSTDTGTLNLYALINELQAALTKFENLIAQRGEKSLAKPDKTAAEVRKGIEDVYRQIETVINSGAVLNPTVGYTAVVNRLNPQIELLNATYHRVRYDIKDAQPEDIPAQIFTGKPITPLTKVLYVTLHDGTVQLELGKDFNLSYKNNVEVGVAECTIHGKGAYKGSKTVTFVIVHAL
jgi:predicted transcriptional regulator